MPAEVSPRCRSRSIFTPETSRDVFDVHDVQEQRLKYVPHADFFLHPLDTRESEHTLNRRVTVA